MMGIQNSITDTYSTYQQRNPTLYDWLNKNNSKIVLTDLHMKERNTNYPHYYGIRYFSG